MNLIYVANTYKTSVSKVKINSQRLRSRVKVKDHTLKKKGGGCILNVFAKSMKLKGELLLEGTLDPFGIKD